MSLAPSNEKAPASASRSIIGNGLVAFRASAHRGILAIFGSKIPQQECVFLILPRLADLVTIHVAQESIIAVQERQHTVKKRSRWLPSLFESNVLGKLQPPVVIHTCNAVESGRVMGKNCLDSRPESRAAPVAHGAPCQITLQYYLQYRLVDAWKKGIYVNWTVPNMLRLAQQRLEFIAGRERTPLRAIGIVIMNKAFVPQGFKLAHNPIMPNPVGKGRREYLSRFWIGNDKHCVAPRGVGFGRQSLRQRNDDLGQIDQRTIRTHSLVDISGASKKFGDNILKIAI